MDDDILILIYYYIMPLPKLHFSKEYFNPYIFSVYSVKHILTIR